MSRELLQKLALVASALVIVAALWFWGLQVSNVFGTTPLPQPSVSIQDLMKLEVDPAADYLWDSVGTVVSAEGTVNRRPHTDEAWNAAFRQAVMLSDAANLLLMDGRPVAAPGKGLEDEGVPGVLDAAEVQAAIDADRAGFNAFAAALGDLATQMMHATQMQDPVALMNAGDSLDAVCEGCHARFWYPNQVIPEFPQELPDQAPAAPDRNRDADVRD